MKWNALDDAPCSIARSLSVVGDRWTLLILRDAFMRVRRFDDFQRRLGITRHLLASRLSKLVALGVFEKIPYLTRPLRHEYRLTPQGRELYPVLMALVAWGDRWMAGDDGPPLLFRHAGCDQHMTPVMTCSGCGERLLPQDVSPEPGPGFPADMPLSAASGGTGSPER